MIKRSPWVRKCISDFPGIENDIILLSSPQMEALASDSALIAAESLESMSRLVIDEPQQTDQTHTEKTGPRR